MNNANLDRWYRAVERGDPAALPDLLATDFKVMIRPIKALNQVCFLMAEALAREGVTQ